MLKTRSVHTFYGKSHVLHGVDIDVGDCEIVALLGRNGVGKTTLLRSIAGLTPCRSGSICFDGKEIQSLQAHEIFYLGISYIPQGRHIFSHLTVLENLRLGMKDKRARTSPLMEKIYVYFPVLKERLYQKGGTLSGGEQQMLAISRGLVGEVRIMLLDEPSEGLQPSIVQKLKGIIRRLNEEMGISILLVEQNMDLALDTSSRYFVMEKGVVVNKGSVQGLDRGALIRKYLTI